MKKLVVIVALLSTNLVFAQTINWIVPGSVTGGFSMLSKIYAKHIENTGIDIDVVVAGNCVNGMSKFRQTTDPTVMIYTLDKDDIALRKGCEFESPGMLTDTVTAHLMSGVAATCTMDKTLAPGTLQNGKEYTVAVDNARNSRMAAVFQQLGILHKAIKYENSGSAIRGMIGGDTQLSFTLAGQSESVIAAGGKCLFVAGHTSSTTDIPSADQLFNVKVNYHDNVYVLLAKNLSTQQRSKLIAAIEKVKTSPELDEYAKKKWLVVPKNSNLDKLTNDAVKELF